MNRFEALRADPTFKPIEMTQHVNMIEHMPVPDAQALRQEMHDPAVRLYDELTTLRDSDYDAPDAKQLFPLMMEVIRGGNKVTPELSGITGGTASGWLKAFDGDWDAVFNDALISEDFNPKRLNGMDAWLLQGMAALYARAAIHAETGFCTEKHPLEKALCLYRSFFACVTVEESATYRQLHDNTPQNRCRAAWGDGFFQAMQDAQVRRCADYLADGNIKGLTRAIEALPAYEMVYLEADGAKESAMRGVADSIRNAYALRGIAGAQSAAAALGKLLHEPPVASRVLDIVAQQVEKRAASVNEEYEGIAPLYKMVKQTVEAHRAAYAVELTVLEKQWPLLVRQMLGEVENRGLPLESYLEICAVVPKDLAVAEDSKTKNNMYAKDLAMNAFFADTNRAFRGISNRQTASAFARSQYQNLNLTAQYFTVDNDMRAGINTHFANEMLQKDFARDIKLAYFDALPADAQINFDGRKISVRTFRSDHLKRHLDNAAGAGAQVTPQGDGVQQLQQLIELLFKQLDGVYTDMQARTFGDLVVNTANQLGLNADARRGFYGLFLNRAGSKPLNIRIALQSKLR